MSVKGERKLVGYEMKKSAEERERREVDRRRSDRMMQLVMRGAMGDHGVDAAKD